MVPSRAESLCHKLKHFFIASHVVVGLRIRAYFSVISVIREPNLSLKIAGVGAIRVGYESDAAFSKAFKRVLGLTPGEHRSNGMRPSQPTAV